MQRTGVQSTELIVFLDELEASGRAPGTVQNYASSLRLFLARVPGGVRSVTALDVRDYLDTFPSVNTRGVRLVYLRHFFRALRSRGLVDHDPTEGLKTPRKRRRPYGDLSEAEMGVVLARATPLMRLLVLILYRLGSRVTETCQIRAEHVFLDGDEGVIDFPSRKGGEPGYAAFYAPDLAEALRAWLPDHRGWLFPDPYHPGEPIRRHLVEETLARVGKLTTIGGKLTPHRLRHVFATHAVDAGWNLLALQQQLGHRDPASTAAYYHPSRKGLLEACRRVAQKGSGSV